MSKAFTSEDSGAPELPLQTRRPQGGPRRPITRRGLARLEHQREALQAQRAKLLALGQIAHKDLARAEVERKLADVEILLSEVEALDGPQVPLQAAFDTVVRLEDDAGEALAYHLVGPDEADVRERRLSVQSPLARALLGKKSGDGVTFERPRGTAEYRVLAIEPAP